MGQGARVVFDLEYAGIRVMGTARSFCAPIDGIWPILKFIANIKAL